MAANQNEVQQITNRLDNVNFPASKDEIANRVGNEQVTIQGRTLNVREVINRLPKDRYNNVNDIREDLRNLPEFRT